MKRVRCDDRPRSDRGAAGVVPAGAGRFVRRTFRPDRSEPMTRLSAWIFVLLFVAGTAAAQRAPQVGVVWDPPSDVLQAEADLRAMRAMGFDAVRTRILRRPSLLELADVLGLELYQEVTLPFRTGSELTDTLGSVRTALADALVMAEGHRSARMFGFAFAPATSEESVCAALAELADFARRRAAPEVRYYYVSWLPESDRCAGAVDLVLLDDPVHDRPLRLLNRWRGESRVGLAAVGRRVDPEAARGLLVPDSEERQALFLEETLPAVRARRDLAVAFVFRWQDPPDGARDAFHPSPFGAVYGLQDETGRPRLARDVVEGILVRGQTTFRLLAGSPPGPVASWFVLLGWLVLATMAILVAASPRFRSMIPRYFFAHGFYRHAIQEGRDVLSVISTVLLVLLGTIIGLLGAQVTRMLTDSAPVHALWYRATVEGRAAMDALLTDQALLVVFIGSAGLLTLVFWVSVWTLAMQRRSPLKPSQALATAVWPRWPMLVLLIVAMVLDGVERVDRETFRQAVAWMPAAWFLIALWGTIRTNVDLAQIARVNPAATVVLWLVSPVVLLMAGVVAVMLLRPELSAMLWALWSG